MPKVPEGFESKLRRPTREELEEKADSLIRAHGDEGHIAEVIDTLLMTAENINAAESVAKFYPAYKEEDFKTLAELIKAKFDRPSRAQLNP